LKKKTSFFHTILLFFVKYEVFFWKLLFSRQQLVRIRKDSEKKKKWEGSSGSNLNAFRMATKIIKKNPLLPESRLGKLSFQ
jgi:hypothetical protein